MEKQTKHKWAVLLPVLKYAMALVLPIVIAVRDQNIGYVIMAFVELVAIVLISDAFCRFDTYEKKYTAARIVSGVLLFFSEAQYTILYFGSTFLSYSMVDNLDSWRDISGKFYIYIPLVIVILLINSLPVYPIRYPVSESIMWSGMFSAGEMSRRLSVMMAVVVGCTTLLLWNAQTLQMYSPYGAAIDLVRQKKEMDELRREVEEQLRQQAIRDAEEAVKREEERQAAAAEKTDRIIANMKNLSGEEFYKDSVAGYKDKPAELGEKPNVILVFMEGITQSIMEDPRDIMPNLKKLEEESIYFYQYYNHTFATYMALSGQLYSGYQQANKDVNVLISLQDILHTEGYRTVMINTEPQNADFSGYLQRFNFDDLLTSDQLNGKVNSISDKDAFAMLYDTAIDFNKKDDPFFLCMYSFGTHTNQDSPDEIFGDGKNPLLNRTYNADVWLGEFIRNFRNSELMDNTILVITADHATYADADYKAAFPAKSPHPCLNRIPMLIYHKGVVPEVKDMGGHNSLDLAPTILDYLDISAPNCFLGESLFAPPVKEGQPENIYDTTFYSEGTTLTTKGGILNRMDAASNTAFREQLKKYLILKLAGPGSLAEKKE